MFSTDDTIAAIATPLGRSGVGVVRLSGPHAAPIVAAMVGRTRPLLARRATFARLAAPVFGSDLRPPLQPPSSLQNPRTVGGLGTDLRPLWQPPSSATASSSAGASGPPAGVTVSDQVIVTFFPQPRSYTGEDVVEVSAHGSPVVLQGILRAAMAAGARLAEPGEFTLRAFLNGKLDLAQAEAVADLVNAVTPLQARAAFDQLEGTLTTSIRESERQLFDLMARLEASLDFPDEGYHFVRAGAAATEIRGVRARLATLLAHAARGRLIREGAHVAILGTPNVGKSSLFNALLNTSRAIVTAIPGTTRDLLTERADIRGFSVALVDTAGIRESADVVEQEGVSRARQAASIAQLTVLVLDRSRPLEEGDRALLNETASTDRVVVVNKTDLIAAWSSDTAWNALELSATSGDGLDRLTDRMAAILGAGEETRDQPLVTNVRHIALLEQSQDALDRALDALASSGNIISEEFVLADLQDAAARLQEITGRRTTDEILHHIFEKFCIGK